jgi:osomolarity two-component system sensor histidine kinase NIK1
MVDTTPTLRSEGATPFESHLLDLLSQFSAQPSPSYPFPPEAVLPDFSAPTFHGHKTPAQDSIERAILALGNRARIAERAHTVAEPPTNLLTPEWTPPVEPEPSSSPRTCPNCARTDATPKPPQAASAWADSGMSAEKELELLKAQVQDIARVCKVGHPRRSRAEFRPSPLAISRKRSSSPSRASRCRSSRTLSTPWLTVC